MYPAGFYYSSSSGNKAHKSRIHNYVSTLAKNGWAMVGPVGPVPVPMLYGNQVESYLVMWLAILFKNGDEEDNDSMAVFINSATFGFGLVSSCSEHLASSWKLWCKNGEKKKRKSWQLPGVKPWTPGSYSQCSATESWQPDNHQPIQSSVCTAQVILNASVTHLAATQYVLSELC